MLSYFSKTLKRISLLTTILLFNNCSSIFVEDITQEDVSPLFPLQNMVFSSSNVKFKWQKSDKVHTSRVQIVTNSFENPTSFVIDSLVENDEVVFTLPPNDYEWRVRGENNVYNTQYTKPIAFQVLKTLNLEGQTLNLKSPQNNSYINDLSFNFSWEYMEAAKEYIFKLTRDNTIIKEDTTANNYFLIKSGELAEGVYTWEVKAINSFSETQFFNRTLSLDKTLPNTPNLITPVDSESTSSLNVTFIWNTASDVGVVKSPITSFLEISRDSNFNEILDNKETSNSEITYSFKEKGVYFWRLLNKDQAGNSSTYSEARKLTIQ